MNNPGGRNKFIKEIDGIEHVLYEVSAEIFTVLQNNPLFKYIFRGVPNYENRIIEALSHSRTEVERTKASTELLKDLWQSKMDAGPYLVPSLLADFEFNRVFHPRYRDHSVHQLRVFLLGLYLYTQNDVLRRALQHQLEKLTQGNLDHGFADIWLIMALYHDQGYVFELNRFDATNNHSEKVLRLFNEFFETPLHFYLEKHFSTNSLPPEREKRLRYGLRLPAAFQMATFDDMLYDASGQATVLDDLQPLVDIHNIGPKGKSLRNYFELARNEQTVSSRMPYYDHGIVSAVMLVRCHRELLDYLLQLKQAEEEGKLGVLLPHSETREIIQLLANELESATERIRHAAAAIAVHNIYPGIWDQRVYASPRYDLTLESFKISLASSPLAFLLALCDTLQDWDRHRFIDQPDYIKLDQHMLISATPTKVGIHFFPDVTHGIDTEASYQKLHKELCAYLNNDDVNSLLVPQATITLPGQLSSESIDRIAQEARIRAKQRLEVLQEKWNAYRELREASAPTASEQDKRSRRLRHFAKFLQWCEEENYNYVETSAPPELQAIYTEIMYENNDLNMVQVGTVIEGRRLLQSLGEGAYGTVFKTQHTDNGSIEALKVFRSGNFFEEELVKRFKRGHISMSALDHPQITKVSPNYLLIPRGYFMEYVDGPNLYKFLNLHENRVLFKAAGKRLTLLIEMCRILEYAHREQVRHRDIKPENILMRWSDTKGDYEPVLTDFDLAWYMQAAQISIIGSSIKASILYSPPELKQIQEDPNLIQLPTVDVFSMGRLLYFVFTDKHPEEDIDLEEELRTVVKKRYTEVSSQAFAWQLASVYKKATRFDRRHRYQTVEEFRRELEQLQGLIGASTKEFSEELFLLELALRLNNDNKFDEDLENAKESKVVVRLVEGEMIIETVRPHSNHGNFSSYWQVRIQMSKIRLASLGQRNYERARQTLNSRMQGFIDRTPLTIHANHGGGTDAYTYQFRMSLPNFENKQLELVYSEFSKIRSLLRGF